MPWMEPEVAVMVVPPVPTPVARPPLAIVATPVFVELHAAVLVRFCVLPSLYVPVATYCCVPPLMIEVFAGVTAIVANVAAVTVNPVDPLMDPDVAVIVLLPVATPVARPPLVIVATPVFVELHVTVLVRFCVLPSLYVPVATYCCVPPVPIEPFAGVTAIDTNGALPD